MSGQSPTEGAPTDLPPHRYDAARAAELEATWQQRWEDEGTFHTPNPTGNLSEGFERVADAERLFVMDMFPYPSGAGLHVGHPLGFIGTDVYARYKRMNGYNVLHTMGFDAFGLPAEQYAVQTGQHPRVTTEANIETYRAQLRRLGLGHDPRRSVATTDQSFVRWTQWIFLQLFNSWFDVDAQRARPISELEAEFASGSRVPTDVPWAELDRIGQRAVLDDHRLAYVGEAMVNWCPGLGTVLANEEVTADNRSDRGNFPVFKRPLRQWMMRITSYNERLLDGLNDLDWPEPIKLMQRNWIGRSTGADVRFSVAGSDHSITVFTTRPDTLFGATYLVLAPENPLVEEILSAAWPDGTDDAWTGDESSPAEAVAAYRAASAQKTDVQRQADAKEKTGVFTGAFAVNPVNGNEVPIFIADYVLMGYGTGAIMAVPAEDQRDWDFAQAFNLPIIRTVQPPDGWDEDGAFTGDGVAINSDFLDGLAMAEAKAAMIERLESDGSGNGTITYKLRDWLFSRQRYWGEPFPIVWDGDDMPVALPESELPILLPEIADYAPRTLGEDDDPEPPLGRAADWANVELDIGAGMQPYRRELNTMPQWAGSCSYYLRYIDPDNDMALCDPELERYWLAPRDEGQTGGVDLYVGGVEHAVLHLLYSRFWHMVLFDLGHVTTKEPFQRLFNQGYIQAAAYLDERGQHVEASEVVEENGTWFHDDKPVTRQIGKMGKSLKNSVAPDDMCDRYGADAFRMYEMFTGPLDQSRPWETKDVVGVYRVLQRIWRLFVDEHTGDLRVSDVEPDDETMRVLHQTIAAVREGMDHLRFNVSIAKLTALTNHLTARNDVTSRSVAEPLALMLAPLAPHMAEELWSRLGHTGTLAWADFPVADDAWLTEDTVEIVVQVKGKVRAKLQLPADADAATMEAAARADSRIAELLDGVEIRKVIPVPGKLINFVTA